MKILIIRFSSIGDIIITTPIIKSLRDKYPRAKIDFLTKEKFVTLLKHNPYIDNIISFEKANFSIWELRKIVKKANYSLIIDLHNSLRSRFVRAFLPSKIVHIKKKYFKRFALIRLKINFLKNDLPIYKRYYEPLKFLDLQESKQYIVKFLNKSLISVQKYLKNNKSPILIALSSAHNTKKWPTKKFIHLIKMLKNHSIILLGGKKELLESQYIQRRCPQLQNLTNKLSLLDTVALMSKSRLLICHDSGLLHLGQSQNLPTVAIFGCTTYELGFFPVNTNSTVVEKKMSCRPCTHNGKKKCPRGHFDCMKKIQVQEIVNVLKEKYDILV